MRSSLKDLPQSLQTVLLRVDLNVPMQGGKVTDLTRMTHIKPSIDWLKQQGHSIILLSHFGRPKGIPQDKYSLRQIIPDLEQTLDCPVKFFDDSIALKPGEVALYENLRFNDGEEANSLEFAKSLAALGDCYVNDAFSASHRAHASIVSLPKLLPAFMGLGLEKELKYLEQSLENPKHPVVAIIGGAKVSTKLALLENLMQKVDHIVIGGAMANTFLKAKGYEIGRSLFEDDMLSIAQKLLSQQATSACQLHLPLDVVAGPSLKQPGLAKIYALDKVPIDAAIFDGGPESAKACAEFLKTMKTVLWNGPLGVFEVPPFDQGTNVIAQAVATLTKVGTLISVAGGGDTVAALNHAGCTADFTYVSTAGGAFLEWLEGKELPGILTLNH